MAMISTILVDGQPVPKNLLRDYLAFRERPAPRDEMFELIAHRGFRNLFPENTMTAYNGAVAYGATSLECDVRMSSDGVPVLMHDATVTRTTNGSGNVSDMTLAQLQALDAGTKFNPVFAGARVPTFAEFLDFARARSLMVYPEIKGYRTSSDIEIMVQMVLDRRMEGKVVFQSFTLSDLQRVRELTAHIHVGLLSSTGIGSQGALSELGNASYLLDYSTVLANPGWVQTLRDAGIGVGVWTVNSSDDARRLARLGVNRIMSDQLLVI